MKREVFAEQEVAKLINTQVIPVIIDIDNPETKTLVKHYKVGATPTTIIVDAEGKVLDYAVGKIEKKKFLKSPQMHRCQLRKIPLYKSG